MNASLAEVRNGFHVHLINSVEMTSSQMEYLIELTIINQNPLRIGSYIWGLSANNLRLKASTQCLSFK